MTYIKASVKSTLIVSGRAGVGLIKHMYDQGLVGTSSISNVIVFSSSEKKTQELKDEIAPKNYQVPIEFVAYDKAGKYLDAIKASVQDCLTSNHAQKLKDLPEFLNDLPSDHANNAQQIQS